MATYPTVDECPSGIPRPRPGGPPGIGLGARLVTVVFGAWLCISAFLWPHPPVMRANSLLVGLLSVAVALCAIRAPLARFLNTALSLWLLLSTVRLIQPGEMPLWSNLCVALAMFAASFIPNRPRGTPRRRPRFAEV
jgi:hypothetical protein